MNIILSLRAFFSDLLREQRYLLLGLLGNACCLLVVGRQGVVSRVRQEQAKDPVVLLFTVFLSSSNHHQSISIRKLVRWRRCWHPNGAVLDFQPVLGMLSQSHQ